MASGGAQDGHSFSSARSHSIARSNRDHARCRVLVICLLVLLGADHRRVLGGGRNEGFVLEAMRRKTDARGK